MNKNILQKSYLKIGLISLIIVVLFYLIQKSLNRNRGDDSKVEKYVSPITTGDDAIKYLCTNNQTFVLNNRDLCSSI